MKGTAEIDAVLHEKKIYTYEDYAKLPEGSPYQLIGGKLIMTPAPSTYHQEISKRLEYLLYEYAELKQKLGKVFDAPIDVYFEEEETYQPDIIFISNDRIGIIKKEKIEGAPDIIIEILSPSTAYYDLVHKKDIYAKHGVKEYWIVDPIEKWVESYKNENGKFILIGRGQKDEIINSSVLIGFKVKLDAIFV
ncbi:Uma2 family endonuclease [Candidatus Kuenenia sp.]|uniref:Uma2 family endonuclease n=1 Tax=Candidatus Kuenenia sp. TaxID=2499824 RepID=UPI00322049D9